MKRSDAGIIDNVETRNVESLPTLRDHFAMSALQGLLANQQCAPMGMSFEPDYLSRRAYRLADAMLEARK